MLSGLCHGQRGQCGQRGQRVQQRDSRAEGQAQPGGTAPATDVPARIPRQNPDRSSGDSRVGRARRAAEQSGMTRELEPSRSWSRSGSVSGPNPAM